MNQENSEINSQEAVTLKTGTRVLLVDDCEDNQVLVRHFIERAGGKVDVAANGIEGLERTSQGDYDIVLMDIEMPLLDGNETIRYLRDKGFSRPILVLTAHGSYHSRLASFEAGCTDYLVKPVSRDDLIWAINSQLEYPRKPAQRPVRPEFLSH